MTNTTRTNTFRSIAAFAVLSLSLLALPAFAGAATYAYVDAVGEVRSVTANDWRTAIATAQNIHVNSGVFILRTAAEFTVIGDIVPGAK